MLRLENLELVHLRIHQHDNDKIEEVDDNNGFSDDSDDDKLDGVGDDTGFNDDSNDDKLDGVGDSRSWSSGGGGSSVATSKLGVNIYLGIFGNVLEYLEIFWNIWKYFGIF